MDLTFTAENQSQPLCVDVLAQDNNVLEMRETFAVLVVSQDAAVLLPAPSTLAVFDDDCKYGKLCTLVHS